MFAKPLEINKLYFNNNKGFKGNLKSAYKIETWLLHLEWLKVCLTEITFQKINYKYHASGFEC